MTVSYTVEAIPSGDYLHVRVRGRNSRETVRGYLRDVLAACAAHGARSLLIEEHLDGPSLPVLDMVRIAAVEGGDAAKIPGLERIAYVDTNPEHAFEAMTLGEDVARSRGLHVRLCRTVAHAVDWIRSDIAMSAQRARAGGA